MIQIGVTTWIPKVNLFDAVSLETQQYVQNYVEQSLSQIEYWISVQYFTNTSNVKHTSNDSMKAGISSEEATQNILKAINCTEEYVNNSLRVLLEVANLGACKNDEAVKCSLNENRTAPNNSSYHHVCFKCSKNANIETCVHSSEDILQHHLITVSALLDYVWQKLNTGKLE